MIQSPIQRIIKLKVLYLTPFFLVNSSFSQTPVVGSAAPEITFSKSLDKKIPSNHLKGKIIILDFWTTWCGPCIASFPVINKLAEKYKANADVVFAALTYEPASKVETFFFKRKKVLNTLKLIDKDSITNKRFGITGFPQTFVIDKNGIVRWHGVIDSLNTEIIDKISSTEFVKTITNVVTEAAIKPFAGNLSEELFKNLDSINNEPGLQLFTRKLNSPNPASATLRFDPGKTTGIFYFNALSRRLLTAITFATTPYRQTSISVINKDKGTIFTDIIFKVDTVYLNSQEFNVFENMYFPKGKEINFLLYSLSKKYNFECRIKMAEFETYELQVGDSALLRNHFTLTPGNFSRDNIKSNVLEVSNYSLSLLYRELKNRDIIIYGLEEKDMRLDLTLDMKSIDALKKSFAEQGFNMINKGKVELPVFEIEFK